MTGVLAGVSCFKIEGRLKGPEYVALTTKVYREAIDKAWADLGLHGESAPKGKVQPYLTKEIEVELKQVWTMPRQPQSCALEIAACLARVRGCV